MGTVGTMVIMMIHMSHNNQGYDCLPQIITAIGTRRTIRMADEKQTNNNDQKNQIPIVRLSDI